MESQDISRIKKDLAIIENAVAMGGNTRLGHKWFSLWLALNLCVAGPLSVLIPMVHFWGRTPSLAFASFYIPTILILGVWMRVTVSWYGRWKSERNLMFFAAPVVALQLMAVIAMVWVGWKILHWQPGQMATVEAVIVTTNMWDKGFLLCGAYSAMLLLFSDKRLFSVTAILKTILPLFILFFVNIWGLYGTLIVRLLMLSAGLWLILKFSSQIKNGAQNDAT